MENINYIKKLNNKISDFLFSIYKPFIHFKLSQPNYIDRYQNKNFLIIAGGPTVTEFKKEIIKLKKKYSCIVISVNNLPIGYGSDYHVITNRKRFSSYVNTVNTKKTKLLLSPFIQKKIVKQNYLGKYEEVMYVNRENDFSIKEGIIQSNCRTVATLSVAIAIVMGADRIFIAGMDGYGHLIKKKSQINYYGKSINNLTNNKHNLNSERKNDKYLNQINNYQMKKNKKEIIIVTPTRHSKFHKPILKLI